MQARADLHTGDLRVDLYQKLIDQCQANTNEAGSSSSLMFSLLIAGKYILIGLSPPPPEPQ